MNLIFLNKKNNKKGFSLLELILAIAIFSLGSIAMATLLIDSNISTKIGSERTSALFYAREGAEAVRLIRDNSGWSSLIDGTYGVSNAGGDWSLAGDSDLIDDKYTRTIGIYDHPTYTLMKNIIVTVSWNVTSGRTATTTLNTMLGNWKNE